MKLRIITSDSATGRLVARVPRWSRADPQAFQLRPPPSPPPPPPPVLVLPVAPPVAAAFLDPHELQRLARAAHALEGHEARAHALGVAAAAPLARGTPLEAVLAHADAVHEANVHLAGAAGGWGALVATLGGGWGGTEKERWGGGGGGWRKAGKWGGGRKNKGINNKNDNDSRVLECPFFSMSPRRVHFILK